MWLQKFELVPYINNYFDFVLLMFSIYECLDELIAWVLEECYSLVRLSNSFCARLTAISSFCREEGRKDLYHMLSLDAVSLSAWFYPSCPALLPYNLYCVGGDVKHCSLTRLVQQWFSDIVIYTVFRKNTHSQFLTYLNEWCVDLNKNCSGYT